LRKPDIEMLEVRLEPLQTARDRHNEAIHTNVRHIQEIRDRVGELEKMGDINGLAIEQGLASIRSLLQRANRAAREQGIIEDDDDLPVETAVDNPGPEPHRVRQRGNRLIL